MVSAILCHPCTFLIVYWQYTGSLAVASDSPMAWRRRCAVKARTELVQLKEQKKPPGSSEVVPVPAFFSGYCWSSYLHLSVFLRTRASEPERRPRHVGSDLQRCNAPDKASSPCPPVSFKTHNYVDARSVSPTNYGSIAECQARLGAWSGAVTIPVHPEDKIGPAVPATNEMEDLTTLSNESFKMLPATFKSMRVMRNLVRIPIPIPRPSRYGPKV